MGKTIPLGAAVVSDAGRQPLQPLLLMSRLTWKICPIKAAYAISLRGRSSGTTPSFCRSGGRYRPRAERLEGRRCACPGMSRFIPGSQSSFRRPCSIASFMPALRAAIPGVSILFEGGVFRFVFFGPLSDFAQRYFTCLMHRDRCLASRKLRKCLDRNILRVAKRIAILG